MNWKYFKKQKEWKIYKYATREQPNIFKQLNKRD